MCTQCVGMGTDLGSYGTESVERACFDASAVAILPEVWGGDVGKGAWY